MISKNFFRRVPGVWICCALMLWAGFTGIQALHAAVIPQALEAVVADDGSTWERVNAPGFGSDNNFSVVAMAEYQDRLYAMTRNQAEGTEVWRTSGTGWEQVLFPGGETNGFYGNPWLNNVWGRMIVFNDKLYFGVSAGLQGNYLGSTGCEVWRYDGTTWEPVISDKKDVDGAGTITAISGCAAADGDPSARITDSSKNWTVDEWAGGTLQITSGSGQYRKFYIIGNTADTLTIQQNEAAGTGADQASETEDTICTEKKYTNMYPRYDYILGAVSTGDSFEIGLGTDESGFGEIWNKTVTDMIIHDGRLYLSTGLNYDFGAQVWYTDDGDTWNVTTPANSFGNYHKDPSDYPGGYKPVSSSLTNLAVFNGELYAGGTGTSGDKGSCSRMAKLTASGWQMIIDRDVDSNDTGTNENGFGDGMLSTMGTGNFMPWSLATFNGRLHAGINSLGGLRVLYTETGSAADDDGAGNPTWQFSVGWTPDLSPLGDVPPGTVDLGTPDTSHPAGYSSLPLGFDNSSSAAGDQLNIAVNLFPAGDTMYGGVVCMYVPEWGFTEHYGAQIWKTWNGINWAQITGNGLGDSDIITFEAFTEFDGTVYVSGSKGASSTPSGLGGAKIYRLKTEPCVTVTADPALADTFSRHTVTGITTPLPVAPDVPGYVGAAQFTVNDIDNDGITEIVCSSGTGLAGPASPPAALDGAVAVFTWDGVDLDSWQQTILYESFAWPNEIVVRDMDGDGDKDIMVMDNFIAGWFTKLPAGIYYLRNGDGDISDPANWSLVTIFQGDAATQVGRSSYHRARFLDVDGDGLDDFITAKVCMYNWQSTTEQYRWIEWFRRETDLVTYPSGFSGPYEIGEGGGFLFDLLDVDDDGDLDVVAPQFFVQDSGGLVVKGPGDINGDSLAWFENPGAGGDVLNLWPRYTIENWYTSSNPLGKGYDVLPVDIDNDGSLELLFGNHNHQDYKPDLTYQDRIWPSGLYYLEVPQNPATLSQWVATAVDTGDPDLDPYDSAAVANDVFAVDRPGGPYSQGSPGMFKADDLSGDGYPDIVVAGDGKGALYYYESRGLNNSCLTYARTALYLDPASMPGDAQFHDIDGDGDLEIISSVFDTSVAKDSSCGSIFIFKTIDDTPPEPECGNGIVEEGEECDGPAGDCEALYGQGYACDAGDCQCVYIGYCGDGIVQPGLGESCESDADCAGGEQCISCSCTATLVTLAEFTAVGRWNRVVLSWASESETANAGFNLYRAEAEDGEYVKINDSLIPAQGSPTAGAAYRFVDTGAQNGKTWFYTLEDVDLTGAAVIHGPVSAKPWGLAGTAD